MFEERDMKILGDANIFSRGMMRMNSGVWAFFSRYWYTGIRQGILALTILERP
jgi:hypothetical protein